MGMFDGWLPALVGGGAALLGASMVSKANKKAAETAAAGQQASTAAIVAGNDKAQQRLDYLTTQGQPGLDYLKTVVAQDPTQLTPQQQNQMAETRRQAGNVLATTGMRGSGRAVTASINNVENTGRGNMLAANQARTDQAARTLADVSTGGTTQAANLDSATGRAVGSGISTSADNMANAGVASANSNANTLGAISGIFAQDARDKAMAERYKVSGGV